MSYSPYLLKGQKALVTGASSGIGEAIARYLASSGAAVAINYHSEAEEAQKIVDDIQAANGEAFAIKADVSKEDEVKAMFSQTLQKFGTVDRSNFR
ncbi:MAG: SDR family NAD(P)-dependent oxidoreductase, partial [Nostoc sp. TH1S01]|nr:SDR family NAD(P)-dependent oxidoreductase [Nostoc sp. TH1S01]